MGLAPRAPEPAPSSSPGWSYRTVEVDAIRWRVGTIGRGPTILLLHGTGASSHSFLRLGDLLAERHRVVAPDLPGHAETQVPADFEPTLPNMARAVARLIASLREEIGEPVVLGGHSAGAAVCLRLVLDGAVDPQLIVGMGAALRPFQGVTRTVFPALAKTLSRSMIAARLIARRSSTPTAMRKLMDSVGSTGTDIEPYRELVKQPDHVAATLKMMASWELEPLFASLHRITQPVLLVAGRHDRATPVADQRAVASRLPHVELVCLNGAGHLVHEEAPRAVARLLKAALHTADDEERA